MATPTDPAVEKRELANIAKKMGWVLFVAMFGASVYYEVNKAWAIAFGGIWAAWWHAEYWSCRDERAEQPMWLIALCAVLSLTHCRSATDAASKFRVIERTCERALVNAGAELVPVCETILSEMEAPSIWSGSDE